MYKVILVPASCGESALDVSLVEKNANEMADQGYELVQVYETKSAGCTGMKTSCVMVYKRQA
jgi:hypothetical protein